MRTVEIRANEALWVNSMLPKGFVVKWVVADGALAIGGRSIAEVRIEGALHDIVAPESGRLKIEAAVNNVVEPGALLATLVVP